MKILVPDIDECTDGVGPCEQECANTVGSYTCSCRPGYTLNSTRCDGMLYAFICCGFMCLCKAQLT